MPSAVAVLSWSPTDEARTVIVSSKGDNKGVTLVLEGSDWAEARESWDEYLEATECGVSWLTMDVQYELTIEQLKELLEGVLSE